MSKKRSKPVPYDLTPKGWVKANAVRAPGVYVPTPDGLLYVPPKGNGGAT